MNEDINKEFETNNMNNFKKSKSEYNEKANETLDIANEINNEEIPIHANANSNNISESTINKIDKSKSCIQRRVTFDKLNIIEIESYKYHNLSNTISPNFDEYSTENKSTRFKMIECCCIIM